MVRRLRMNANGSVPSGSSESVLCAGRKGETRSTGWEILFDGRLESLADGAPVFYDDA
jgi:hypothetical protein